MDKNATPLDLSTMPLTPAAPGPAAPPQPKPTPPPASPPAPPAKPAPVTLPTPAVPPLSHDVHNGGPVAPPVSPPPPDAATHNSPVMLIVTIVAILVLAVVAAVGAFYIIKQRPTSKLAPVPLARPEPSPRPLFLQVLSPQGETDMVNGELLVAGTTLPNTPVSVYSDIDDSSVQSDAAGHFETTVALDEGGGAIKISAYSPTGEENSQTIEVGGQSVLGKSDARGQKDKNTGGNNEKSSAAAPVPTTSTAEAKKPSKTKEPPEPAAFLAVKVKDQLPKLGPAKLKEILTNPTGSGSAALQKKVVEAKPASASAALKRHGMMGVVTDISANSITIRHQNDLGAVDVILFNINTVIQSESDKTATGTPFAIGDRINAVGYPSTQGLLATRIHIIPGTPVDVKAIFNIISPLPMATPEDGTPSAQPTAIPAVASPSASPTEKAPL